MTFLADPNMTGDEMTLLTTGGNLTQYPNGELKATEEEQTRIDAMLKPVLEQLDFCRVVRRTNGELAVAVDFEFLYDGSEELQGSDEENRDELDDFYFSHQPGPVDYRLSSVEAFVKCRYVAVQRKLAEMDGAELCFVTNRSFVEARIYLSESAVHSREILKVARDAALHL